VTKFQYDLSSLQIKNISRPSESYPDTNNLRLANLAILNSHELMMLDDPLEPLCLHFSIYKNIVMNWYNIILKNMVLPPHST
jgi:hypothetical protein